MFGDEVFELAVDAPAILQLAVQLDGEGEIGEFRIAPLQLDAGPDMAGPCVVLQSTQRRGKPAARALGRFSQIDRGRFRIGQRPVGHDTGAARQMRQDGGMHFGATAIDQHGHHVGGFQEAVVGQIAAVRLLQQGQIGLRQFGQGCGCQTRQQDNSECGPDTGLETARRHDVPSKRCFTALLGEQA